MVEGTDLEEVHVDEEAVESAAETEPTSGSDPNSLVSLPIVEAPAAPTPAVATPQPEQEEGSEPKKKNTPASGAKRKTQRKKAPKPDDASNDSDPSDVDL